jgi:hypothetical protein
MVDPLSSLRTIAIKRLNYYEIFAIATIITPLFPELSKPDLDQQKFDHSKWPNIFLRLRKLLCDLTPPPQASASEHQQATLQRMGVFQAFRFLFQKRITPPPRFWQTLPIFSDPQQRTMMSKEQLQDEFPDQPGLNAYLDDVTKARQCFCKSEKQFYQVVRSQGKTFVITNISASQEDTLGRGQYAVFRTCYCVEEEKEYAVRKTKVADDRYLFEQINSFVTALDLSQQTSQRTVNPFQPPVVILQYPGRRRTMLAIEEKCQGDLYHLDSQHKLGGLQERLALFYEIVCQIKIIHQQKRFHGDLSLHNILLTFQKKARISDFGLAMAEEDLPFYIQLSCSSQQMGGSDCPPEAKALRWARMHRKTFDMAKIQGAKMDMWALGIVATDLFLKPFPRPDWQDIQEGEYEDKLSQYFDAITSEVEKRVTTGGPLEFYESLYELLSQCFNKNPQTRWDIDQVLDSKFVKEYARLT